MWARERERESEGRERAAHLRGVEVVCGREAGQAGRQEHPCRDHVGGVEREVAPQLWDGDA